MTDIKSDHDTDFDLGCCPVPTSKDTVSAGIEDLQRASATSPEVGAMRAAGFQLLLEEGRPIEVEEWAAAAGIENAALREMLDSPRAEGRVQLDDDGRLLGIAGLTVEPGRHQLDIDGTIRWTWCALDAVGILGALEADGTVRSTDPRTGDPVEIRFKAGKPEGDTTLFILGGYDGGNVIEDWCPLVNFFATRDAAEAWVEAEGLEGDIVTVAQIATDATNMWRPVVDPSAPQVR